MFLTAFVFQMHWDVIHHWNSGAGSLTAFLSVFHYHVVRTVSLPTGSISPPAAPFQCQHSTRHYNNQGMLGGAGRERKEGWMKGAKRKVWVEEDIEEERSALEPTSGCINVFALCFVKFTNILMLSISFQLCSPHSKTKTCLPWASKTAALLSSYNQIVVEVVRLPTANNPSYLESLRNREVRNDFFVLCLDVLCSYGPIYGKTLTKTEFLCIFTSKFKSSLLLESGKTLSLTHSAQCELNLHQIK